MEYSRLPNDVKIFSSLLKNGKQSRQNLSAQFGLSIPTVSQAAMDLQEMGLVREDGTLAVTGGRKARLLSPVTDAWCALGFDLTARHFSIALVDLSGNARASIHCERVFEPTDAYFNAVTAEAEALLAAQHFPWTRILGAGISIPGIVSTDHQVLEYSHVLHLEQFCCDVFTRRLPCSCALVNDAKAAATAEFWNSEENDYAVYLALSDSVGGAIVRTGEILDGIHHRAGEFGHTTLVPDGRKCYCGRYGCLDAYCNAALLEQLGGGSLDEFFRLLRGGAAVQTEAWREYVRHLSTAISSLHSAYDCPIVLGGSVGAKMDDTQLAELFEAVQAACTFTVEPSMLRLCRPVAPVSATGAALTYIRPFLCDLGCGESGN